jgi:hypothetical protein
MARAGDREKLRAARAAVRRARADKRAAKKRARETCRAAKRAVTERARAAREGLKRARLELRTATKGARVQVCHRCRADLEEAVSSGEAGIAKAKHAAHELADEQARERRWARGSKPSVAKAREARGQSDDDVRANLSGDELIVWEAVRSRIKPTGRMTRTEAFQHWLHEHQGEVLRILDKRASHDLKELERLEREYARDAKASYRRATNAQLARRMESIVPF